MTRKHEEELKRLFKNLSNYITNSEKRLRKNEYNRFVKYLNEGYPNFVVESTIYDITHCKL